MKPAAVPPRRTGPTRPCRPPAPCVSSPRLAGPCSWPVPGLVHKGEVRDCPDTRWLGHSGLGANTGNDNQSVGGLAQPVIPGGAADPTRAEEGVSSGCLAAMAVSGWRVGLTRGNTVNWLRLGSTIRRRASWLHARGIWIGRLPRRQRSAWSCTRPSHRQACTRKGPQGYRPCPHKVASGA